MRISIGLVLLALSSLALGHHSRSHYPEQKQELSGELVEVHWTNPHVGFTVSVANGEGEEELWRVEGRSNLFSMERGGATRELFHVGGQVTFLGSASVRRPRDMLATHLLLDNGTEVLLDRDAEPRWSEDNVGRYDSRISQGNLVDALSENRGISESGLGPAIPPNSRATFPLPTPPSAPEPRGIPSTIFWSAANRRGCPAS